MSVDTGALWVNVVDVMYEVLRLSDDQMTWLEKNVEEPVRMLICEAKGTHDVVDDQCNRPEHRFCTVCGVRQPNEPVSA